MAAPTTYATIVSDGGRGTGGGGRTLRQLWKVFTSEPVANSTSTLESAISATINGFDPPEFNNFGCWIKVDSTGPAPTYTLTMQESWDDTAANYVVPNANGTITTGVASTSAKVYSITPTPMPKFRFQVSAVSQTATDVVVTMYLFMLYTG